MKVVLSVVILVVLAQCLASPARPKGPTQKDVWNLRRFLKRELQRDMMKATVKDSVKRKDASKVIAVKDAKREAASKFVAAKDAKPDASNPNCADCESKFESCASGSASAIPPECNQIYTDCANTETCAALCTVQSGVYEKRYLTCISEAGAQLETCKSDYNEAVQDLSVNCYRTADTLLVWTVCDSPNYCDSCADKLETCTHTTALASVCHQAYDICTLNCEPLSHVCSRCSKTECDCYDGGCVWWQAFTNACWNKWFASDLSTFSSTCRE